MGIYLEYGDLNLGIQITAQFKNNTLLVGKPGAGKTSIINALYVIGRAARGCTPKTACRWRIGTDYEASRIEWEAVVEYNDYMDISRFVYEAVTRDGDVVADRSADGKTNFFESSFGLTDRQSIVLLFEDLPNPFAYIHKSWEGDYTGSAGYVSDLPLEDLLEVHIPLPVKAYLVSCQFPNIFENIKEKAADILPYITDLEISVNYNPHRLCLFVHEGKRRVCENDLPRSVRMVLWYLFELYLTPKEGTILMDDFGDGLSVSQIVSIMDNIDESRPSVIMTTKHPTAVEYMSKSIVENKNGVISIR